MNTRNTVTAPNSADIDALAVFAERIHTACLTVGTFPKAGPRAFFSTWPAYRLEFWDAEEEGRTRQQKEMVERFISAPRFAPTAKQIDDCLPALALLNGATALGRAAITARAFYNWYRFDGGWRLIGDRLGISHTSARTFHNQAINYAYLRSLTAQRLVA